MKHIFYTIAWILLLVVNIPVWLLWFLPMYKKGTFEGVWWDWDGWCWHWDVNRNSNFYKESMKGWWGFVIGSNIVYVDYFPKEKRYKTHIKHEKKHVWQNYTWNIFFYPAYITCSIYIYCFQWNKHAYLDNPFEIAARKAAGQKINIPITEWTKGPNDRWPWF